jgi:hypothetical protein
MLATPPPSDHFFPFIFYYQPEHTFVLDMIIFAQTLTTIPPLSLGGIFEMVYEHLSRCFILEDPSFRFLELFKVATIVAHGNTLKLMAQVLRASKLLAMVKDTGGLCPIVVGKMFLTY